MLKFIYKKKMREFGDTHDYDMSYMEELVDIYPEKASLFIKAMPLAGHNGFLPDELYYAIKIRSMQIADCGPCLKLTLNMAAQAGLPKEVLSAILKGEFAHLSSHAQLGWAYADAVMNRSAELDTLVREIEIEFGKRGLWDASLAAVYGQFYPLLKRGLGIATICAPVSILMEEMDLAG